MSVTSTGVGLPRAGHAGRYVAVGRYGAVERPAAGGAAHWAHRRRQLERYNADERGYT